MPRGILSILRYVKSLDPRVKRRGALFGNSLPEMQFSELRGELRSSVIALGGGGYSRLGLSTGKSLRQSTALVQRAYELGINHFDTSNRYGTSRIFARALAGVPRETYLLSSKISWNSPDGRADKKFFRRRLHEELRSLNTGHVDILSLHAVPADGLEKIVAELYPEMQELQRQGKARLLGISEGFVSDPGHKMLQRTLQSRLWDMAFSGFNVFNQSAREKVVPYAQQSNTHLVGMFAVRRAMRNHKRLQTALRQLEKHGVVEDSRQAFNTISEFLEALGPGGLQDLAYRFVRHEPGFDVTLFGTGNIDHLEANVQSLLKEPLPQEISRVLLDLFADAEPVTLN